MDKQNGNTCEEIMLIVVLFLAKKCLRRHQVTPRSPRVHWEKKISNRDDDKNIIFNGLPRNHIKAREFQIYYKPR